MRRFLAIFKMDMENLIKNPVLVNANTLFPALIFLILSFLVSGSYARFSDAGNYYIVTVLITTMLNGAMTASNSFMERDIKKPNLRILYSPVGRFPLYFSKIAASALFDTVCHLALLAVLCPLFHLNFGGSRMGCLLALMVPIEFASCALGALFCCIFKGEETTSSLLSTVISVLSFLGGTFFSFDGMGGALAFASRLSPVKWLNDAFFTIIYDGTTAPVLPLFAGAVAVSALLVGGCAVFFKTEDYIC